MAETKRERELEILLATALATVDECEATLLAIQRGDADALVVIQDDVEEVHQILKIGGIADSLFNLVENPIFIVDCENKITRINCAAESLFGSIPAGTIFQSGVPLRPLGSGSGASTGRELPVDWMAAGYAINGIDMAYQQPDGEIRYFQVDAKPIINVKNSCTGGVISLTDITERKRSEIRSSVRNGQLHYQLQLTKSITDNVTEGLILLDENYRVVMQNRASAQLFGLPENSLLGTPFFEKVPLEPDPDAASSLLFPDFNLKHPLTSGTQTFRALLVHEDGTRVPVHCFHSVLAVGNGSILVIRDIRIQIAAEKALLSSVEKQRQSQKMEAIGRLAGGIAHDFNNLLLAILGFTDLSLAIIKDQIATEYMLEVKKAGERAAVLTSQLLAYSRKQVISLQIKPINHVVLECQKLLERLIGESIKIEIDLCENPLNSKMDELKIQQVLINIALNARDSMPNGGTLTITTKELSVTKLESIGTVGELLKEGGEGPPPGKYAVIEVSDTGHGMGTAILDRLFEPFFTTKEFGKGSGLGLSTAFGIVRQMNGFIQVFSEIDKGSIFKILMPLDDGMAVAPKAAQKAALSSGAGETILVVEDESVVRRLIVKFLIQDGYNVLEASNGVDALEKLDPESVQPNLIITDVLMDKMGGIELAMNLKSRYPLVNVLFISGYSSDTYEFPVSEFGESHFLAKPFSPSAFLKKVKSMIDPKRVIAV